MEGSPGLALAQPFAGGVLASQDAAAASRGQQQPLLVEEARRILNPAQPLNDYDVQLQSSPALSNGARTFAELTTAPFQKDAYAADPSAFQRDPVCIGPYLLDEPYAPGAGEIRLVRNDAYYGANTGFTQGGAGYADEVVFRIYADEDDAFDGYLAGEVDLAALPLSEMHEPEVPEAEIVVAEATEVAYLGFATQEEYQNTPAYRKAWSQLLDREQLVSDVFGLRGQLADGFFPPSLSRAPGLANSVEAAALAMPECELPAHDVAAGAETLAPYLETNPGQTPDVMGLQPGGDGGRSESNLMTAVATTWRDALDVGFPTTNPGAAEDLATMLSNPSGSLSAFEMMWSSTALAPVAMFNDPQPWATALFSREGLLAGTNPSAWVDGGFEYQLNQRLGGHEDPVTRQQAVDQMGEILCDELPMLPLAFVSDVWVVDTDTFASAREVMTGKDGLPLLRELYRR